MKPDDQPRIDESRIEEDEALLLLSNRILLDYISLQIDRGLFALEDAKKLVRFSASEVKRGAPGLSERVDFFADVLVNRFDETDYEKPDKG